MPRTTEQRVNHEPDVAYITPTLVTWALRRSRIPRKVVAHKLKVDLRLLESWEQPEGPPPPFTKALALAKLLHVPFGFLYLHEPPEADLPLPDFRGFDPSYKPSSDFIELLNDISVKQDWFRDHEKEAGAGTLKFVGSFTARDSVEDVAAAIRTRLEITMKLRESATTWSDYLTTLARRAGQAGILVMRSGVVGNDSRRKLQTGELLGFAIADRLAPVVFVNSADFRASQIFTLAHELAHIWIGQSAIANPDELAEETRDKTETFCNRVAAEVLVPRREFLKAWHEARSSSEVLVGRMARRFWVSSFVTLRRAHELGEVDSEQYEIIKRQERERRKQDRGGGGDYYRNVLARMSPRLTDAVLTAVNSGKLEIRDAAGLLNMKAPTLVKFAEKWK